MTNTRKNIIKVLISQTVMVLSGIITGFVIPKILGVNGYGMYKLFTMYFSYTSLLHFGFIDGFLLKYGGKRFDDLDKLKMRLISKFYILFQSVISLMFILIGLIFLKSDIRFIVILLGINTLCVNVTSYYQFISQATERFKELSTRNIITSSIKIVIAIVLGFLFIITKEYSSYQLYILLITLTDGIMLFVYLNTYKDITIGKSLPFKNGKALVFSLFKKGIVLTIAYQIGHLIFIFDRQFVSWFFDDITYSIYSFAYSIITIFTTLIKTISTVFFPLLKRLPKDEVINIKENMNKTMSIVSSFLLLSFFPLVLIIKYMLPEYFSSVKTLMVVYPSLILHTLIFVIDFTVYNVFDKTFLYFLISLVVFIISVVLNFVFYYFGKTVFYISIASIITLFIWYFLLSLYLFKTYKISFIKNLLYVLTNIIFFYLSTNISSNIYVSCICYFLTFVITLLLFYKDYIFAYILKNK